MCISTTINMLMFFTTLLSLQKSIRYNLAALGKPSAARNVREELETCAGDNFLAGILHPSESHWMRKVHHSGCHTKPTNAGHLKKLRMHTQKSAPRTARDTVYLCWTKFDIRQVKAVSALVGQHRAKPLLKANKTKCSVNAIFKDHTTRSPVTVKAL